MVDKCIKANPDLGGIGIRINLYVTLFLAALTPESESMEARFDGIFRYSVIYVLSLAITAFIRTIQNQLDLYHAILVMHTVSSINTLVPAHIFGQRKLLWSELNFRMKIYICVQFFFSSISIVWSLYVWIKGSNFGPQPSCNHLVKYVFFFVSVRATVTWLRVLMSILLLVSALLMFWGFSLIVPIPMRPRPRTHVNEELQTVASATESSPPMQSSSPPPQGQKNRESYVSRFSYRSALVSLIHPVYIVATLELIVHRNHSIIQDGENVWGFSQIIATILTVGMLTEVLVTLFERHKQKRILSSDGIDVDPAI